MSKIRFEKIAEQLRKEIFRGDFPCGSSLPGERVLAERFHVSRPTLRKALDVLIADEIIAHRPGIGNEVLRISNIVYRSGSELQQPSHTVKPERSRRYIGFFISDKTVFYCQPLAAGAEEYAQSVGVSFRFLTEAMLLNLRPGDVCGVISASSPQHLIPHLTALQENGIPVVTVNKKLPPETGISCVRIDAEKDIETLIFHALKLGYRKIACIGGHFDETADCVHARRTCSWRKAYEKLGLPVPQNLIYPVDIGEDIGKMTSFLRKERPEILFCVTGSVFTPATCAASAAQIRVPEEMKIFCFDDVRPFFGIEKISAGYALMPLLQMGAAAAERILRGKDEVEDRIFIADFVFTDSNSFL